MFDQLHGVTSIENWEAGTTTTNAGTTVPGSVPVVASLQSITAFPYSRTVLMQGTLRYIGFLTTTAVTTPAAVVTAYKWRRRGVNTNAVTLGTMTINFTTTPAEGGTAVASAIGDVTYRYFGVNVPAAGNDLVFNPGEQLVVGTTTASGAGGGFFFSCFTFDYFANQNPATSGTAWAKVMGPNTVGRVQVVTS
jgi:hypothetical protein